MLLIVEADEEEWLADVGFGAALLEPLPFGDGAVSHQGGWTYGLARGEGGVWLLRSSKPTHPASSFVGRVVAIRTTPEVQHTLRGRELTATRPDGTTERRDLAGDEPTGVLRSTSGISTEPEERDLLRSRL